MNKKAQGGNIRIMIKLVMALIIAGVVLYIFFGRTDAAKADIEDITTNLEEDPDMDGVLLNDKCPNAGIKGYVNVAGCPLKRTMRAIGNNKYYHYANKDIPNIENDVVIEYDEKGIIPSEYCLVDPEFKLTIDDEGKEIPCIGKDNPRVKLNQNAE